MSVHLSYKYLTKSFKRVSYLYLRNSCHGLMQKAINFNDNAVVYVKGNAYRIHFWYMSKDNAINIMNNSNLIDKKNVL